MKPQHSKTVILMLAACLSTAACDSMQQEQVTSLIREKACENISGLAPAGSTRLQDLQTGCAHGVQQAETIVGNLVRQNHAFTIDDVYYEGLAWCYDTYGREGADRPRPDQVAMDAGRREVDTFSTTMLLGCNLGLSEGLTYAGRLEAILAQHTAIAPPRRPIPATIPDSLTQCLPTAGSPRALRECLSHAPLSETDIGDLVRALSVEHQTLVTSGATALEHAIQNEEETSHVREGIATEQRRRDQANQSVADLDRLEMQTQTESSQANGDDREKARLDGLSRRLPQMTAAAQESTSSLQGESQTLSAQTAALSQDLQLAQIRANQIHGTYVDVSNELSAAEFERDNALRSRDIARRAFESQNTPPPSTSFFFFSNSGGGGSGSTNYRSSSSVRPTSNTGGSWWSLGSRSNASPSYSPTRSAGGGGGSFGPAVRSYSPSRSGGAGGGSFGSSFRSFSSSGSRSSGGGGGSFGRSSRH